jgi:hypothetical protein
MAVKSAMLRKASAWAVVFLAVGAQAFYQGTDVLTLTGSNFESKIKSGGVWLVEVSHSG